MHSTGQWTKCLQGSGCTIYVILLLPIFLKNRHDCTKHWPILDAFVYLNIQCGCVLKFNFIINKAMQMQYLLQPREDESHVGPAWAPLPTSIWLYNEIVGPVMFFKPVSITHTHTRKSFTDPFLCSSSLIYTVVSFHMPKRNWRNLLYKKSMLKNLR